MFSRIIDCPPALAWKFWAMRSHVKQRSTQAPWKAVTCLSLCLLVAGCSKQAPPPPKVASAAATSPDIAAKAPDWVDEEPSEEILRTLEFSRYAAIEALGGLPLQSTNTGRTIVLHPKLYEVHKEKCSRQPQRPPGAYECQLRILISLAPDGREPSYQGERIKVKRDAKGEWTLD